MSQIFCRTTTQKKTQPQEKASQMKKKPINYVDGRTLHNQLVEWYKTDNEKIPDVIVLAVMQICERLGTKSNFRNYSFISDMISGGLLSCTAALQQRKYDPTKGENPFAYFTQIAYNEFIRVINEEKKHSYIKHKSLEHHITDSMLLGMTVEGLDDDASGRISDLVDKFEEKKNEKRAPGAHHRNGSGKSSKDAAKANI